VLVGAGEVTETESSTVTLLRGRAMDWRLPKDHYVKSARVLFVSDQVKAEPHLNAMPYCMRVEAVHTVPGVFQDSTADVIAQSGVHNPLPVPLIVALLSLPDLLFGSSELRAARHAHIRRHCLTRKEVLESLFVVATSMNSFSVLAFLLKRLDLVWTTQQPRAPDVDVSLLLEIGQLETSKHGKTIVVWVIVMPLIPVGVYKQDVVWELVVVINDVARRL
jgi:hypothetical protein